VSETNTGKADVSITNELAMVRNREAAERTLLAWLRTCLSFISFGFAIFKIVQTVADKSPGNQHLVTFVVAFSFILLGSFALIAATVQHVRTLRLLDEESNPFMQKNSLGVSVSLALILIGLFASIAILVEFFILK